MDQAVPHRTRVSVIMATFNGQAYIRQAVASVLNQTLAAFELIIVDDCSTDDTPRILAAINDPRVRVFRNAANIGVVESRNRAFAEAGAEFTAMLDHDDLCLPTRLAKQVAYLDNHPDTVLIGTAAHTMEAGRMGPPKHDGATSPALIGWLLLVANPLVCSSVMFRTQAARSLPCFMRADYAYADDFDLYHRLAELGRIARLDETLTIYRLHGTNASRRHEEVMSAGAARALLPAYRRWLPGEDAEQAAALITRHAASMKPAETIEMLRRLRHTLTLLTARYLEATPMSPGDAIAIRAHAEALWRRTIMASPFMRGASTAADFASLFDAVPETWRQRAARGLNGLPLERAARAAARRAAASAPLLRQALHQARHQAGPIEIGGTAYLPAVRNDEDPPALYVVADIACGGADGSAAAAGMIGAGQAVLDQYGLRPIYLLDEAAARDPALAGQVAAIYARSGCAIGALLTVTGAPARTGAPPCPTMAAEAGRLDALTASVQAALGVRPAFVRAVQAARPADLPRLLRSSSYLVDFSMQRGTARKHGQLSACAYWVQGVAPFLTVPVPSAAAGGPNPGAMSARDQIRLIKSLLRTGTRDVVLHYDDATLTAGAFAARLDAVCRYFFAQAGGVPGFPDDLLARARAAPSA